MKYRLILILCLLNCVCFAQKRPLKEDDFPPTVDYYLWTKKGRVQYAFFNFDAKRHYYIFNKNYSPSKLSKDEVRKIEDLISSEVKKYNNRRKYETIKKSERYYKQFVAVENPKGEKEVWVNCSCEILEKDWKENVQITRDGGSCFFNLKINLTKKVVYDFWVNGVA